MSILGCLIRHKMRQELTTLQHSNCLAITQKQMTNSNQLDFYEPTLQQVADLCSQFGFTCAGEADLACLRAVLREGFSRWGHPALAPAEGERQAATEDSSATVPAPVAMIPVEYMDLDSGARIVSEPSEEGPGGCWVVLNSRLVNPLTEFSTAEAAWNALQTAHALPLPAGEVEP